MDAIVDTVVIGGGVIGAAVARALAADGREVWLLERSARLGGVTTERNSGVIHAGLYYPERSLKTRLCVEGARRLYEYCARHEVPHAKIGKLIVARDEGEASALEVLASHGRVVGAEVSLLGRAELKARAPEIDAVAALWSPNTGIVDPIALTQSLFATSAASALTHAELRGATPVDDGYALSTARGEIVARRVVNAAGLWADDVAALFGAEVRKIHPCRGDYYRLRRPPALRHLVYPVKRPGAPGLGVHLTLDLAGGARLGPDTTWVSDKLMSTPAPDRRHEFAAAASYLRGLRAEDLEYDSFGLRPKLRAPTDPAERDFELAHGPAGVIHLYGMESPGLTACLAIADEVAKMSAR